MDRLIGGRQIDGEEGRGRRIGIVVAEEGGGVAVEYGKEREEELVLRHDRLVGDLEWTWRNTSTVRADERENMLWPYWNDSTSCSVIAFFTVSSTSQQRVNGQKSRRERRS